MPRSARETLARATTGNGLPCLGAFPTAPFRGMIGPAPLSDKAYGGSMQHMKYVIAVILLAVALGLWGSAFAIYYGGTSLGGYSDEPCSKTSC